MVFLSPNLDRASLGEPKFNKRNLSILEFIYFKARTNTIEKGIKNAFNILSKSARLKRAG